MKNSDNLPDVPGDQMFSSMEAKHPDHWLKSNYFSSGCLALGNPFNFRLPPLCPVFHSVIQSFSLFVFLPLLLLCVRVALPILTTTMKLWDGRQGGSEWGAPLWEWALSRVVVLAGFLVSCIFMLWDCYFGSQPGICFSQKELDLLSDENIESPWRKSPWSLSE